MGKTLKMEKLELELPEDVLFCLRGSKLPKIEIKKKVRIALAVDMFTQGTVTLAKAAKIAEMSRYKFMELLKDRGIPLYEYTERTYEQDQEFIANYKEIQDGGCG